MDGESIESPTRLCDIIKEICIPIQTNVGFPEIYKLPSIVTKTSTGNKGLRKVIVGPKQSEIKYEIKILIVGQTGSGKTTLLNGFANYLYGVEWEDNFRFKIVTDEYIINNKTTTDSVTTYTFYWQPGFPVPCTVTLIDTPGFGDERGIEQDEAIVRQIESLLKNENDCGIDSLNAVAFVVQSSIKRLDTHQHYIFDTIMKIFGKDIADNFIIVTTFADVNEPEIPNILKEIRIPTNYVCKFNNSALFAKTSGDNSKINQIFWNIGYTNYENLFLNISKMRQNSLSLTLEVFDQRKRLFGLIDDLRRKEKEGITKISEIKHLIWMIERYECGIQANKHFTIKVKKVGYKQTELRSGEHAINCTKCYNTCHYPCMDSDLMSCAVMNGEGICTVCGCHWTSHHNMPYKWEFVGFYEEEKTHEAMKQEYEKSISLKISAEKKLEYITKEIQLLYKEISNSLAVCKNCIDNLQQIALKTISLRKIDFIQLLIQIEQNNHQQGWQERVDKLTEHLEQQILIKNIIDGKDIISQQMSQIKDPNVLNYLEKLKII